MLSEFGSDCEFSVMLEDGSKRDIVGIGFGENGDEDAVFIAEGAETYFTEVGRGNRLL
jgi:hypothetical protein